MEVCTNIKKPTIRKISQCVIKPKQLPTGPQKKICVTPWGLSLISIEYGQGGFLFWKPHHLPFQTILQLLKDSLSITLSYYFVLAGRLETIKTSDTPSAYSIFINCSDCPGAEFIYAAAEGVRVSDITSHDNDIVESFFPFVEQVPTNHDGHANPLLYVQVTELVDGIFLSMATNHVVVDGNSFWHFSHAWSEISSKMVNGQDTIISHPPIFTPWTMENHGSILNLPSYFIEETKRKPSSSPQPQLRNKIFKLSAKSLLQLKAQAITECKNNDKNISSFQALNAFLWRCITRARRLPSDQKTTCLLAADDRAKLQPPLSKDHFGCYVKGIGGITTAGELLANNLGWSASILHEAVVCQTSEEMIVAWLKDWKEAPCISQIFGENFVVAENSPRFDVYDNDFGWGKPVSVSIGRGNKTDGTMFFSQSREGGNNIDIEVNLCPEFMNALLQDPEFMNLVHRGSHGAKNYVQENLIIAKL